MILALLLSLSGVFRTPSWQQLVILWVLVLLFGCCKAERSSQCPCRGQYIGQSSMLCDVLASCSYAYAIDDFVPQSVLARN